MKKLLFTALIGIGLSTAAFATDESEVSFTIKRNFKEEFKNIKDVDWSIKTDFVKATFKQDGKMVDAFYDFKGNKIGMSQYITIDELPLSARKTIERRYPGAKITEAIKFDRNDEDSYYVTVEDEKQNLVLKIEDTSNVSVFKKTKKNKS